MNNSLKTVMTFLKMVMTGLKISFNYLTRDFIGDVLKFLPYALVVASAIIILTRLRFNHGSILLNILCIISGIYVLVWLLYQIGKSDLESQKNETCDE